MGNPDDPCIQNYPPQDCPPMYAILRWASVRFTFHCNTNWYTVLQWTAICWLSFLTSPSCQLHCQIGHGMQVNSSQWHHVLPRIFSLSDYPHPSSSETNAHWLLSAGRIRLSRLVWLLRQVFRFDFYYAQVFCQSFWIFYSAPTTGGRNFVFNPGWLDSNIPSIYFFSHNNYPRCVINNHKVSHWRKNCQIKLQTKWRAKVTKRMELATNLKVASLVVPGPSSWKAHR